MIGRLLGPYKITEPLGAGGMGEVYLAEDTRLGRKVAIKVLPAEFSADPQRLARFELEARAAAALNHPHIAVVHDIGSEMGEDGTVTHFMVQEYLQGQTLRDEMERGPVPLSRTLSVASEIAQALQAAHAAGIVHRDLKPENVFITQEGHAKILDFGLAKLTEASAATGDATQSPTLIGTMAGTMMGTVGYMAPEQTRGDELDQRADIWAFGVLLHEMLTGTAAFAERTVSDTVAAILTRDLDLEALPHTVRRLLRACLQKEPRNRLRDIGDAWLLIDEVPPENLGAEGRDLVWLKVAAALVLGAMATAAGAAYLGGSEPSPPIRFLEYPPAGTRFTQPPLLSPDGRHLAFLARDAGGRRSIWVRALDMDAARELEGTGNAWSIFWSPDSAEIGFVANGEVRRVRRSGSGNQLVAAVPLANAGVWVPDGDLFISTRDRGVVSVSPAGGTPREVLSVAGADYRGIDLVVPGSRLLLQQFGEQTGIYVADLDGTNLRPLLPGASTRARFLAPDYLVYQDNRGLVARRFNPSDMVWVGDPQPIAQDVGPRSFEIGPSGGLSFVQGDATLRRLTWFDRSGEAIATVGSPGQYSDLYLSSGGSLIMYAAPDPTTGNEDLWVQDVAGSAPNRLTSNPDIDHLAVFSPDGREVAWEAHRGSDLVLMRRPTDGSANAVVVREWNRGGGPTDWSPDGLHLLYTSYDGPKRRNIWAVPLVDGEEPFALIETEFDEADGRYSPGGRWLAYSSDAAGTYEVYLQRLNGTERVGGPQRVSTAGGVKPLWSSDGTELFFLAGTELMVVETRLDGDRPAGTPRALFDLGERTNNYGYAVAPDGQSILAIVTAEDTTARPATVVLNWSPTADR